MGFFFCGVCPGVDVRLRNDNYILADTYIQFTFTGLYTKLTMGKQPTSLPITPMFLRAFRKKVQQKGVSLKNINRMSYENVVLHMCTTGTPHSIQEWSILGINGQKVNRRQQWSDKDIAQFSNTNLDSPFQHVCLLITGQHGKTLLFKDGNGIRAGKYTVAHAYINANRLCDFTNTGKYYTAMSIPNSVVCGQFRRPLSDRVKDTYKTVDNQKFPGVAVTLKKTKMSCTPELYTGRNKQDSMQRPSQFIAPGFKTVSELVDCASELDELSIEYSL